MTAEGALSGIRVIDLSRVLAGPLCTQTLGDLGAEVIKVERPGEGDDTRNWGPPYAGPLSAYFLGVNRNKQSVTLDLALPKGRAVLDRMIRSGDVLVDNFKRGTLDRWGFDDAWFESNAPGVVRCSITGYGSTGPKADNPGYDFILQAESGLMAITGEVDGPPMKLGVAIVDICTGMQAAIAILAALEARHRTGVGQRCEVNLHDTGLHLLANVASNHLVSGDEPGRYGNGHPNIVPYRTYRASDGDLALAVGNDRQFGVLAQELGHPEWAQEPRFATNPERVRNRDAIDQMVAEVVVTRSREDWVELFDRVGIPSGPINLVSEALASPQTRARQMVTQRDHPIAGQVAISGLPITLSDTPTSIRLDAPALGANTDEVLFDIGYSVEEIAGLKADGIVI
ncbi:MAG TPA: CaiB/BaiF CoA-transferase family protein [Acidimicrobiia bacterium]|nr:CaiB/BaiF CoA-transferase family protein [Acidimicrobiia bacterium]